MSTHSQTSTNDQVPSSDYLTASSCVGEGSVDSRDEASPCIPIPEGEDEEADADPATDFKNKIRELQSLEHTVTVLENMGHSDKPALALIRGHREQAWKIKAAAEAARVKLLAENVALSLAHQAAGGSSQDTGGNPAHKRKRGADDDHGRERLPSFEPHVQGARKIIDLAEFYGPQGTLARHHAALGSLDTRVKAAAATRDNLELEARILQSMGSSAHHDHLVSILGKLHRLNADMEDVQKAAESLCPNVLPILLPAQRR